MGYPGLAYIGSGKISGLYGLNETIHDQKSIGLQHLYVDNYEEDIIYSALSILKVNDTCYYGDRIKPIKGHPRKQKSEKSYSENGFIFVDKFVYDDFSKTDSVYCVDDYKLTFNCDVVNTSNKPCEMELAALVVTRKGEVVVSKDNDILNFKFKNKSLGIKCFEKDVTYRLSIESPSGFMYHGIQDLLYDENYWEGKEFRSNESVACSVSKKVVLLPGETFSFRWMMDLSDEKDLSVYKGKSEGLKYWNDWLGETNYSLDKDMYTNLIALKAINMNGFLPADLTGHYFASNDIAFYVRDALHGAKAFLFCGFFDECKQVIKLVTGLERKKNHELYQRYNSKLIADEGANNNVFSQIDVIGYLLSIVVDYYELTGDLIVDIDSLMKEVNILDSINRKNGLYGPEGGVNEGVYGPAFITSTNIFIAAGLNRLLRLLEDLSDNSEYKEVVKEKLNSLIEAINNTVLEEGYYAYGFVEYHDDIVKRYDTPQLFGAGLGYPIDENYKKNFKVLTEIATYFDYGYGYSEQQYHDGPWLFNTCYAAQNAYILNDMKLYHNIINWIENHKNEYGLLPEAIDSRDENKSLINPLMWANSEYLCAKQSHIIKGLRNGENYDN